MYDDLSLEECLAQLPEELRALVALADQIKSRIRLTRDINWCALPSFTKEIDPIRVQDHTPSPLEWTAMANTLTNLWNGDNDGFEETGVFWCNDNALLREIIRFNQGKRSAAALSARIKKLSGLNKVRDEYPKSGERFLNAFELARDEFISKGRDREHHDRLIEMLEGQRLSALNMTKVGKQIKLLPETTTRIRYTWNLVQTRQRKLKGEVLHALARHYIERDYHQSKEHLWEALDGYHIHPDETYYRHSFGDPAQRVNYKVWDEDAGRYAWDSGYAAGIMVLTGESVPDIIWKPKPTDVEVKAARRRYLEKKQIKLMHLIDDVQVFKAS